jgi:hypothetical protein
VKIRSRVIDLAAESAINAATATVVAIDKARGIASILGSRKAFGAFSFPWSIAAHAFM